MGAALGFAVPAFTVCKAQIRHSYLTPRETARVIADTHQPVLTIRRIRTATSFTRRTRSKTAKPLEFFFAFSYEGYTIWQSKTIIASMKTGGEKCFPLPVWHIHSSQVGHVRYVSSLIVSHTTVNCNCLSRYIASLGEKLTTFPHNCVPPLFVSMLLRTVIPCLRQRKTHNLCSATITIFTHKHHPSLVLPS